MWSDPEEGLTLSKKAFKDLERGGFLKAEDEGVRLYHEVTHAMGSGKRDVTLEVRLENWVVEHNHVQIGDWLRWAKEQEGSLY